MSFICPKCGAGSLNVIDAITTGPDGYWDETTLQRAKCGACGARYLIWYKEHRVFRSDRDDKVDHTAFEVSRWYFHSRGFAFEKPDSRQSKPWRFRTAIKLWNALPRPLSGTAVKLAPKSKG